MPLCQGCTGYESCINARCKIVNRIVMGVYDSPIPIFVIHTGKIL